MARHTLALLSFSLIFPVTSLARKFHIINECPQPIALWMNWESQGTIGPNGGFVEKTLPDTFQGSFYTDAFGGSENGIGSTQAQFDGTVSPFCSAVLAPTLISD